MILGLTGKKGCGKSAAAAALNDYHSVSFADPLRQICREVLGFTDHELTDPAWKERVVSRWPNMSPRTAMQLLGTDMFRAHFPDVWIECLKRRIAHLKSPVTSASTFYERFVIPDVRFLNEADAIRAMGGCIIRIVRPSMSASTDTHASETEMDQIVPDAQVLNDGTPGLLAARIRVAVLEWQEASA